MADGFDLVGAARSLLNIEVNTIVRDTMTAELAPPAPHAILDIAGEYALELTGIGVDLGSFFAKGAEPETVAVAWVADPDFDSALLTVSVETFDALRWAAKKANANRGPKADRIDSYHWGILQRICNNGDTVKEILKRLIDTELKAYKGLNRAALVGMPIQKKDYALPVEDLLSLQKIWDVGTEIIVAQTVVHITGDVMTRVQDQLRTPQGQALFGIHQQSVDVSVSSWRFLLDAIGQIAGKVVADLFGRPG
jgi:hypothetical protein